ncbi:gibberellin 3-beta-dioxygenase 1-like isoform X1 [Cucurbita pepo subsp. pepo]|uniref:gibberellin 3-beta-dioxygenase 1-like isoform X1 n=1 Tax=Cucurbita pepo subsp. pepo TaxID=3664 RepID=UPI000C9D7526|nr:gibberellin 3-beta-dioxygenase 1-like isoform X1 [Cucurbita pepo subsp. pepo]
MAELHPIGLLTPLDLGTVKAVPESHVWSHSDESSQKIESAKLVSIPVVDFNDDNVLELIGKACEEWGMFQLINHGVPKTLTAETEEVVRCLFALPQSQKMKTLNVPGTVSGYCMARLTKHHDKMMWHEGFNVIGSPVDDFKKLWPTDYQRFCDIMEEYQFKMKDLADKLISLMFKFLGISDEEMVKKLSYIDPATGKPHLALRLNSFPPCPEPSKVIGMAAHTDTSLFTMLHQTRREGLQILNEKEGWLPLAPRSDALIINIGDFLQIISNGRFSSLSHRVMIRETEKTTMSMAYFFHPPRHLYVAPYCKPLSETLQTPIYKGVNVKEYFIIKAKASGKGIAALTI